MKDAYQLLNEARTLWQQNALSKNDASSITKDNNVIPINMKTPYGYYEAQRVYYDETYGIVFEWDTPKVQLFQD